MTDVVLAVIGVALAAACIGVGLSAVALMGALVAQVRDDHRNPIMKRGLDWYEHRTHHRGLH